MAAVRANEVVAAVRANEVVANEVAKATANTIHPKKNNYLFRIQQNLFLLLNFIFITARRAQIS